MLVIADESCLLPRYGDTVSATGRLQMADGPDLAGVLVARGPPTLVDRARLVNRGIAAVRRGLAEAAVPLAPAEEALVPALVDGDDSGMPVDVADDFRATGLTHLLAVSGTNLTLVLSFVLVVARWTGVRGRGLAVVGVLAVVFFVLLARPQPSVLRAAAMGLVALAGLSAGGSRRGVRALCVAVIVLVLLDPWLARSIGFLLSALATAGILMLAPAWRDALSTWLPRPLAEAVAVPLAAQLVCTPVIAAISGQVSLVAVGANLLVAPAVGPATVAGLLSGLAAVASERLGHLGGRLAGVPAWWIVWVARRAADLDGAAIGWPVSAAALGLLALTCLGIVLVLPRVLVRPYVCLGLAIVLVAVVVQPLGRLGWPPRGWLMVACDVGQGDGLVLNAGGGVAVVVDTGPDPDAMDACLDELEVRRIALVVLTHFHADHVNGLPAVLKGRDVAELEVSPLRDPADRAAAVDAWAAAAGGVPVTVAVPGEERVIGALHIRVLGPLGLDGQGVDRGEEGSGPNNASVVLRVDVRGHRLLLTGDAEPEEEAAILRSGADLRADVFKVAHHGSANQVPEFIAASRAAVAVVSVGADNDNGHPSPETLGLLNQLGAPVYRTDEGGDVAVVERAGQLAVVTSRG